MKQKLELMKERKDFALTERNVDLLERCRVGADLAAAESAFVRCSDFAALQLLHKLKSLPADSALLRAEVAAYFHRFEEAEKIYLDNDRR